jgi:hypothetical protein
MGTVVDSFCANVDGLGNRQGEQDHIAIGYDGSAQVVPIIVALGHCLVRVGERRIVNQAVYGANIDYLMG